MLYLRNMNEDEFPAYVDYFVADYGIEIKASYNKTTEQALEIARNEIKNDLPHGVHTKGNFLLCIELEKKERRSTIGYLWYARNDDEMSAFIDDFYIFPDYRHEGYARKSIAILEKSLADSGIKEIRLRVAYSNEIALALYKKAGFITTGINMAKNIVKEEENQQ